MKHWYLALLALLALPVYASGPATGHIHIGPPACIGSTCGDRITVALQVDAAAVGQPGAIFVALLPVNAAGKPVAYHGAWATLGGWRLGTTPTAYAHGALPATWKRTLRVRQGICALAHAAGYHGRVGAFAGYGEAGPAPSPGKAADGLLQQAERLHDAALVARVKRALTPSPVARDAAALRAMLHAHTFWFLGSTDCD